MGRTILTLVRESLVGWMQGRAALHAAGIAYYTIFSMAPLLIFSLSIADDVYERSDVEWKLVAGIEKRAGEPAATYVKEIIVNVAGARADNLARGVGILFLLYGSSAMFLQLQSSLNDIWGIAPKTSAIHHSILALVLSRAVSVVVVLVVGYCLLGFLIASTLWGMIPARYFSGLGRVFHDLSPFVRIWVSPVINTMLFAIIFKILPQARIRWRDIWPGAILTALLFGLGNYLLGFYLENGLVTSLYGAAGSIMVFLLWVFYSAWIFLYGAKFTQVYARQFGQPIVPYEFMEFMEQPSIKDAETTTAGSSKPGLYGRK
jgi:membrane protein